MTRQKHSIRLCCPKLCIPAAAKVKDRGKTPPHVGAHTKTVLYADALAILPFLNTTVVKGNVFAHYGLQLGNIYGMSSTLTCLYFQQLNEASESPP